MAFEAVPHSNTGNSPLPIATVMAKMARFEGKIPRIELETRAYQLPETSRAFWVASMKIDASWDFS